MDKKSSFPTEMSEIRILVQDKLREGGNAGRIDNWTHISGGAETGSTWKRNMKAYESLGFRMKAINEVDLDKMDSSTNILGAKLNVPVLAAPMSAAITIACDNTFVELAKGAQLAGAGASIGYPTGAGLHVDMVKTGAPVFRLIKPLKDLNRLVEEFNVSKDGGCFATGIDIDSVAGLKPSGDSAHYGEISRPLSVKELKEARKSVELPFIIKGVLSIDDAVAAMEIGADAIVISTHAGYSLDYCPSPLEVLPEISKVVGGRMQILVDSGIMRGSDIVKAIALGADAVLVGRLAVWGLFMGKGEGFAWILKLMEEEMKRIMALVGAQKLSDLNKDCLVVLDELGSKIL